MNYLRTDDAEFDRLAKFVYESYPNACIISIERIDSPLLQTQLRRYEEILAEDPTTTLLELYHGTKRSNVDGIIQEGFKVSHNKAAAYGPGTYLSDSAKFSFTYTAPKKNETSYIFICSVVSTAAGLYCARTTNPNIFRTPHDDLVIPLYLMEFIRQA